MPSLFNTIFISQAEQVAGACLHRAALCRREQGRNKPDLRKHRGKGEGGAGRNKPDLRKHRGKGEGGAGGRRGAGTMQLIRPNPIPQTPISAAVTQARD